MSARDDQLLELAATNLGVIERLSLVFGSGMTAITGETGAGKTLVLNALELLMGGRADATRVGPHGDEAVVEGRFLHHGDELVLQRVVPREGRSRAYVNGRLATAATLAEHGSQMVELHGQNGHTVLTTVKAQRSALDLYGGVDLAPLVEARLAERSLIERRNDLGGDQRERFRELELARFQVEDIDHVAIASPAEDDELRAEEVLLAGATTHRESVEKAVGLLGADGPADAAVAEALVALEGAEPLEALADRVRGLAVELNDVATDARAAAETMESDPQRLEQVQDRRRRLTELRRKYGETLAEVSAYRERTADRLVELEDHDRLAGEIETLVAEARECTKTVELAVGNARRSAAPGLANELTGRVRELALPNALVECAVGGDPEGPGDEVDFRVSMNPGTAPESLARIASGGELARTMLALRLVLSAEPATMVFDEVDAGIGGEAAQVVGEALARLGEKRQVVVVTHLAQVAAFADHQVTVIKQDDGEMVSVDASSLDEAARVVELSRMLSGSPDSDVAREHAAELLAAANAAKAVL